MQNVSNAFRRALSEDKRDYILRATITLTSGTVLTLDNSYIWEGGFTINDAVSNDNSFQVGGAIINGASLNINNVYGTFDEYDFDNARVVMECGLSKSDLETETADEYVKKGVFYVDEATYNDTYIKLSCLDNMAKFDRPYSFDGPNDTALTYPATLGDIVQNACSNCGVTLDTSSQQFPHYTYVVDNAPSGQSTTYRQVISWAAQIAGCFARCNADGKLELKWYDILALEAQMTNLDGGYFDGVAVGWLSDYFNTDTGMDTLQSGAVDDRWFYIENTVGFTFNDTVSSRLYIDSDSCYAFVDSAPTSHGHNKRYDVNICCRDGQVDLIKYQTIDTGSRRALKVRFHGYTRYSSSYATREYELEYEIFFTDNGEIVINFITLPTNSSYFGETSIIENGVTTTLTPSTDSLLAAIRTEDAWEGVPTADHYLSGDTADGGTFDPWNTGDAYDAGTFTDTNNCHLITSAFSSNISTDDVVLTGVRVVKKVKTEGSQDSFEEYTSGTVGYMVSIENNDLIQGTHGQDIADWIGDAMTGFAFRKAELTHPSDPSMEAGDVAVYFDRKNNVYPIIISSTSFTAGNSQNTHSSAETPRKNSATRYTEATREYVEMRRQLADQQTAWEDAVDDLSDRIDAAGGLYSTQVVESGATKIYYHDKPVLNESNIVMLFTTAGFTMTANYQDASPTWYGMTVDGTMIAAIMNTIGINFDWGVGGELIIRDGNNVETLYANAATGVVRVNAQSVSIQGTSVQDEINSKITSYYQAADPSLEWTTAAQKASHVGDIWYCNVNPSSAIPYWLTNYVNTETGLTPLSEVRVDGGWVYTTNAINFSFNGTVSTNVYISSDSRIKFADAQPTDGPSATNGDVHIHTRDGQSLYIGYQVIDAGATGKALKIKYRGYTRYQTSYQIPEYANEYEIFFLNNGNIILNQIQVPTNKTYLGTSEILENNVIKLFDPIGGYIVFSKVNSAWNVSNFGYAQQYWQWVVNGSTYEWQALDTASSKIEELDNSLNQQEIFNRLTNNDANQGIYLDNGKLYLNFTYAHGGTLKLGGQNAGNGVLEVYNANNVEIARIDQMGIRKAKTSVDDTVDGFILNENGLGIGTFQMLPSKAYNQTIGEYTGQLKFGNALLEYEWPTSYTNSGLYFTVDDFRINTKNFYIDVESDYSNARTQFSIAAGTLNVTTNNGSGYSTGQINFYSHFYCTYPDE